MKRSLLALALLFALPKLAIGAGFQPDEVVARASRELTGSNVGLAQTPLDRLIGRAMIEATRADIALVPWVPPTARIASGPVTAGDLFALVPTDSRLVVASMTGARIAALLERAAGRFSGYDFADELAPIDRNGVPDPARFEGLSYDLDLTARPPGSRVIHLSFQGQPLEPARRLVVALTEDRAAREPEPEGVRDAPEPVRLQEALIAYARRAGTIGDRFERDWSVLPDYVVSPERPLIDRLVRAGELPREEALRLFPEEPARRGDFAYWLARAFGWREKRLSGAFPDLPDSLEAWVDGLIRHRVLDAGTGTSEFFEPFAVIPLPVALDWCERAARAVGRASAIPEPAALRRRLLLGTSLAADARADTLTRAQALGIIANARRETVAKRR